MLENVSNNSFYLNVISSSIVLKATGGVGLHYDVRWEESILKLVDENCIDLTKWKTTLILLSDSSQHDDNLILRQHGGGAIRRSPFNTLLISLGVNQVFFEYLVDAHNYKSAVNVRIQVASEHEKINIEEKFIALHKEKEARIIDYAWTIGQSEITDKN